MVEISQTLRKIAHLLKRAPAAVKGAGIGVELHFLVIAIVTASTAVLVGLSDDEAYYWSWSLRPDLSYFDHPPLLGWTLWFTTHVFGKTNFAVRLPAILNFWMCTTLMVYWAKRYAIDRRQVLALVIGSPLFFVFSWMTLPDTLYLPLALLALHFLRDRKFVACGASLGVALLAKWHTLLLLPGVLLAIFLERNSFLGKLKESVKILILISVFQTPVLLWNLQHGGVGIFYQLVGRRQHELKTAAVFLSHGISFIVGFLLVCGLPLSYLLFQSAFRRMNKLSLDKDDVVLLALALPFVIVFGAAAVLGDTRIYWTGFAFFPLSIFLLRRLHPSMHVKLEKLAMTTCGVLVAVFMVCLYLPIGSYARPVISLFRSYDLRLSPRGGLIGWKEWVKAELPKLDTPRGRALFLASDFRLAGQLLWNSDLTFEQVSSVDLDHQYSIWPSPDRKSYNKIVIFGDNERKIDQEQIQKVCPRPDSPTSEFKVYLANRVVKIIEYVECQTLTVPDH